MNLTADAAVVASITASVIYLVDLIKRGLGINSDQAVRIVAGALSVALSVGYYVYTPQVPPLSWPQILLRAAITALAVLAAGQIRSLTPDKRADDPTPPVVVPPVVPPTP
jgi:hypothetical protein